MLLFLVVIQFALWAHAAQVAQLAASEGDRVARAEGGSPSAGVARADAVVGSSASGVAATHVTSRLDPGDVIRISVSGTAVSILPGLRLPVSSAQSGPIQEFRVSG
jgi:hypothetical protein